MSMDEFGNAAFMFAESLRAMGLELSQLLNRGMQLRYSEVGSATWTMRACSRLGRTYIRDFMHHHKAHAMSSLPSAAWPSARVETLPPCPA